MADKQPERPRREFLRGMARWGIGGALVAGVGALALRKPTRGTVCPSAEGCKTCPVECPGKQALGDTTIHVEQATVWQIDPYKCIQCGRCATECVLTPSAVKCVHAYKLCGYCDLCSSFFVQRAERNTGAENQLCPTNALVRKFVEEPYFEYKVDEGLCVGCGKCVKGCTAFGNGSLFLQIRRDRCVDCNDCAIARNCPSQAISRVPRSDPYRLKTIQGEA